MEQVNPKRPTSPQAQAVEPAAGTSSSNPDLLLRVGAEVSHQASISLAQRDQVNPIPSTSAVNPLQAVASSLPPITALQCRVALAIIRLTSAELELLFKVIDLGSGITAEDIDNSPCWHPLQQKLKLFNKLLAIEDNKTSETTNHIAYYLKLGMTSSEKVKEPKDLPRGILSFLNIQSDKLFQVKRGRSYRYFEHSIVLLVYIMLVFKCLTARSLFDFCKLMGWDICSQREIAGMIRGGLVAIKAIPNYMSFGDMEENTFLFIVKYANLPLPLLTQKIKVIAPTIKSIEIENAVIIASLFDIKPQN